mmetsp:Transcript_8415/g.16049  ORF Transcript_8415/g.16049 Transcript_8415/m.16049 type:complete len:224 (+) Transcript_8415:483-1154(+)
MGEQRSQRRVVEHKDLEDLGLVQRLSELVVLLPACVGKDVVNEQPLDTVVGVRHLLVLDHCYSEQSLDELPDHHPSFGTLEIVDLVHVVLGLLQQVWGHAGDRLQAELRPVENKTQCAFSEFFYCKVAVLDQVQELAQRHRLDLRHFTVWVGDVDYRRVVPEDILQSQRETAQCCLNLDVVRQRVGPILEPVQDLCKRDFCVQNCFHGQVGVLQVDVALLPLL